MSYALVQLNGITPGTSIELDPEGPPVTIGRDPQREFPVDDHLCSRLHCRLWFDGSGWRVEDCGSRNGTYVNSRQIDVALLHPGDAIRIGDRLMVFIEQGEKLAGSGWQPALMESTTFLARVPSAEQKDAVVGQLKGTGNPDSVRNAAILCRLAGELHEKDSVSAIVTLVVKALKAGTHANAIVVWLKSHNGRLKRYGAELNDPPESPSALATLAMDQEDALLVSQPEDEAAGVSLESTVIDGETPTSAICVPIPLRSGCRGAIECLRTNPADPLTTSNLELCIAVARQTGLAVENLEYREQLEQANVQLRREIVGRSRIVGESEPIRKLLDMISRVSATQSTVLICGESGTGKELVARMIHDSSDRSSGPYVAVNCAAFNEALLESELFGHEKGAFTGADRRHSGQFERAHRGTIFLDEIGEMSLACQAKLLRLLEGHPFERLGGTEPVKVDVRIVAATHRHLPDRVEAGNFREDLYFRLRVIELPVPPLRERGDDIVLLAEHLLEHFRHQTGRGPLRLSNQAVVALKSHHWPGNVRELKNAIERATVLGAGDEVLPEDLGLADGPRGPSSSEADDPPQKPEPISLLDAELQHIQRVLEQCGGNKAKACRVLGIGRGTLYKKLKEIEDRS